MNRADQRKYHYIYKITRLDTSGKYYIGMHSTDDLSDGYQGSGMLLWHSIKKHGKDKHIKEILEYLPNRKALSLREKELINEEPLADLLCMNIVPGGTGGSEVGRLGAEGLKKKRQDPEFEKQYQAKMLEVGSKFRERCLSEPEFQEKLVEANKLAAKQKRAKRQADPEYDRMVYDKLSAGQLGKKDSLEAKANKSAAQKLVAIRDVESKKIAAAKAREALAAKSSEELVDIKRCQSEGAKRLALDLAKDPVRWASIVDKKRQARLKNGTNVVSLDTRAKISERNTGKKRSIGVIQRAKDRTGESTTGFGTVWMNLNGLRKRVKKCDTLQFEQQGFTYGR